MERDFPGENERLAEISEHVPKTDLTIYGSADMWYAFKDNRNFYHYKRIADTDNDSFIVSAADDSPANPSPAEYILKISEKYLCELTETYRSAGKEYSTWRCNRKNSF
jgi:hypothetical protein